MENLSSVLNNQPIFALLPQEVKQIVINSFVHVSYSFGKIIVQEGEIADAFYVLASGRARVMKMDNNGGEISLYLLRPGDTFGEMGLLSQTEQKRTATVRASSDILAYRLDSSIFKALIQNNPDIKAFFELQIRYRNLHNFFLEYTPFFRLPIAGLKTILSEAKEISVKEGEFVIRQGDEPGPMYIIEDGRLRVYTEENGNRTYRAFLRKGDFFGELSMFKGLKRSASVQAHSPCKLLLLMRESFRIMTDNFPEFITQIEERISKYDYRRIANVPLDFNKDIFPNEIKGQNGLEPEHEEQAGEYSSTSLSASLGPFASPEGLFVKKSKKRIKTFPYIWQGEESDCGAASLAMVCRHFGKNVSFSHIRQLVYSGAKCTGLKVLSRAARELGLEARSIKASKRNLMKIPLPAIMHWQGDHWVVLYDADKKYVSLADPAVGLKRISHEEFDIKWTGRAVLFDFTQRSDKRVKGRCFLSWLWPFFGPFKHIMMKVLAFSLAISVFQMSLPVFIQIIADGVIVRENTGMLSILAFSMISVLFLAFLFVAIQRYLLSFAAVHIDISAMDFLIRKILDLPMDYFNTRHKAEIRYRLEGIRPLLEFLVENSITIFACVIQLSLAFILMFFYSPKLGSVFLAAAITYIIIIKFFAQRLKLGFNILEEFFRKHFSSQLDILQGIEAIKAMGAEDAIREKTLSQFHHISQPLLKTHFNFMFYNGVIQATNFFPIVLFWWLGAYQVINGSLTIGGLIALSFLAILATEAIGGLLSVWQNLQSVSGPSNRLNDIFEQEPEQGADHSHIIPVRTLEGKIRFQNVGFRYGGPESLQILKDISFEVPPGKKVAIVGRNGSGKTTLSKCLCGLLEPTEGTIFYDNVDLKRINHRDLRKHFGIVFQENFIFDGTIANNIALGEKDPDMDQILWAARLSNAHVFIENLPLGYDTRVGETGIVLSASQRQCIAIARAIYHKPSILIFDNATNFLDKESEKVFKKNITKIMEGRTCFMIENRMNNVEHADIIIVIEKGKLVEQGSHNELISRHNIYYYLCNYDTV